jgi:hypothetical protein
MHPSALSDHYDVAETVSCSAQKVKQQDCTRQQQQQQHHISFASSPLSSCLFFWAGTSKATLHLLQIKEQNTAR